jgi:hypothetical protein
MTTSVGGSDGNLSGSLYRSSFGFALSTYRMPACAQRFGLEVSDRNWGNYVHAAQCDVSYPVPRSHPLPPSIPPSLPPSCASLHSLTLLTTRDCPSEPPLRTHAARTPARLVDLIAPTRAQPAEVRARADGRQASAQTTLGGGLIMEFN